MTSALNIAQTGLDAQQTRLAVISNNLANVATTGYKKSRPVFEDLLYQTVAQPGAASSQSTELPSGLMLGTGVRTVSTAKIFTQGTLTQTQNSLDMAIQGRGFLQVVMPDGSTAYTRDGGLSMNSQGQLVTASGYEIEPGNSAPTEIGNLQLADFINPQGLQPIGENLFKETLSSGNAQTGTPGLNGLGTLIQGMVESSNVNAVEELVDMIETQRAYEMNSKAIQTVDEMLQFISQTL
jgi:flagellar basal-body rod protein FlgG